MCKPGNRLLVHVAMLGLYGVAAMNAALAAAPVNHGGISRTEAAHSDSHPRLDLRPTVTTIAAVEKAPATFSSAAHRETLGAHEHIDLPVMGAEGAHARVPSRVEEFAKRVHREGLPVARLWENKSALLSLGLNKKGKPGLWIVQKIR